MRAGKKRAILNARSQEEGGVRMKILVLSDSHGNIENMMRAVEQEQPEMLIHLGAPGRSCGGGAERGSVSFRAYP